MDTHALTRPPTCAETRTGMSFPTRVSIPDLATGARNVQNGARKLVTEKIWGSDGEGRGEDSEGRRGVGGPLGGPDFDADSRFLLAVPSHSLLVTRFAT